MVVPVERATAAAKAKKYVGNEQFIDLKENHSSLKIVGNQCVIRIERNDGSLKIIGDSCHVTVHGGKGSVHYVGNCGKIDLDSAVDERRVNCIGNGVEIRKIVRNGANESVVFKSVPLQKRVRSSFDETCVNLQNKHSLHIGDCQNIFVPLCHSHICIRIPNVKNVKKC